MSNTKNSVREEITEYSARKYVVDGTSNFYCDRIKRSTMSHRFADSMVNDRFYCSSDRGSSSTRVAEKLTERRQDDTYEVTNANEDVGLGDRGEEPSE